ncbi:bifunctional lysylphosphatidylglycerol synthetase/lysine--tRNA ligase LysX [Leekyejoonella antrihumi]|uniref:Lysine--tRNA ligase n=2 Tax=Leekyejoonella antrihumi TaxID=1660198 RepID=A0A563E135_9MICO|nr:bifunctional lysylphosphatidylglycerol synthetase/lysine--tRNA ligase LysX [Leekyejoonella antrihumi]TWP36248.1 bifunctional lysylphosphatidylglycerol synthetase/lysine--tRNA ligase LysX [Leekyejoonella antrihumi]
MRLTPRALQGSITPYGGAPARSAPRSSWREQVAVWVGRLLLLGAVWSLISIPLRGFDGVEMVADLLGVLNVPSEPSLFVVCLMLVLTGAVRRRLRAAHTVVVVLIALNILDVLAVLGQAFQEPDAVSDLPLRGFSHEYAIFRNGVGFNLVSLIVGLVLLVLVVRSRSAFPARLTPGSRVAALGVLLSGLALSLSITVLLVFSLPGQLKGVREKVVWAARSTLGVSTPVGTPGFTGDLGHGWIYGLAGVMSTAALVLALLVFWRSGRGRAAQSTQEELAVRRLLLEHGEHDSLGYFATRRDKAVIFAPDGRAAVTYRVEGSVSVASADPIGLPSSWSAAVQAWLQQCRTQGLYAAVLSSSEEGTKRYVAAGLKAFPLGDEAIIDVDSFSLSGRTMRPVRQAVSRISRAGYSCRVRRHHELSPEELRMIEQLADRWRGNEAERGFSMALNRLGDPADGRCVLVTAHDASGTIRGFLSFVPWGVRGVSLDLMRRDRDAENGLNEYLVAKLIELGPEHGIRRVSLNFAVFRNVFNNADQVGAGPVTKVTDSLLSFASRFYQLETLYRSNEKYRPEWVPRLLCYDAALTVPRAGLAMGVAEGFVPMLGPRLLVGPRPEEVQRPRPEPDFVQRVLQQEDELLMPMAPAPILSEQQRVRRAKLRQLEEEHRSAYPAKVARTDRVAAVRAVHPDLSPGERTDDVVSVCGRVRALRDFGGVCFAVLQDEKARIQVMVTMADTPCEERARWRSVVDLGDLVSVTGPVTVSRRGELSVLMTSWQMAAKCLTPMPDLHATLSEESRVRHRSLDLVMNQGAMHLLQSRSRGVRALREAMQDHEFCEVETPMLQAVHGGATARPFQTHINAYSMDLFLRIAPELYLKRLAVGGMQRVFEIGRNFRNEGVDATHNPEFTALEAYAAYGDYTTMRELTREVILRVATAVNGSAVARRPGGETVDLTPPWPVLTVHDAVSRASGTPLTSASTRDEVAAVCRTHGVAVPTGSSGGFLVTELYDALVEKQTVFPTFYTDFPVETSPLTRPHRRDPRLAERWDLVAFGAEIGTAYSELTDPVEQRRRLVAQSMAAAAGDLEAMQVDEPFLEALELAMPPTGGLGIGVDRLIMMLTGASIRATLAFPFVRPQSAD